MSGKRGTGHSLTRDAKPPKRKNLQTIPANMSTLDPKARRFQSPLPQSKMKTNMSFTRKHRNSVQINAGTALAKPKKLSQSKGTRKSDGASTKDTSGDGIGTDSIASKLLTDIAAKYRDMEKQARI